MFLGHRNLEVLPGLGIERIPRTPDLIRGRSMSESPTRRVVPLYFIDYKCTFTSNSRIL